MIFILHQLRSVLGHRPVIPGQAVSVLQIGLEIWGWSHLIIKCAFLWVAGEFQFCNRHSNPTPQNKNNKAEQNKAGQSSFIHCFGLPGFWQHHKTWISNFLGLFCTGSDFSDSGSLKTCVKAKWIYFILLKYKMNRLEGFFFFFNHE